MKGINYAIKAAMLGGMVLVLSASPLLASGENKAENEKAKVEINKLEINKIDKNKIDEVMLGVKKLEGLGDLRINRLGLNRIKLLDEDILGENIEDLLDIAD